MTITIAATPTHDALTLSGDICRLLPLPAERDCGSVAVALSDGTLLDVSLSGPPEKRFKVAKEGAAITIIHADRVEVQWPIEWLTVSGRNQALAVDRNPDPMPMFPEAA